MRAVVTRVKNARVEIGGKVSGAIDRGCLVLLGVGPGDTEATADKMADKICGLRIFERTPACDKLPRCIPNHREAVPTAVMCEPEEYSSDRNGSEDQDWEHRSAI